MARPVQEWKKTLCKSRSLFFSGMTNLHCRGELQSFLVPGHDVDIFPVVGELVDVPAGDGQIGDEAEEHVSVLVDVFSRGLRVAG